MKLPADIKSIIIFRALQLGDMLCAVPALRALRRAYPQARITLTGLPWEQSFQERFSDYIDDFIWFPGYPGLPEQALNPQDFTVFLTVVQQRKFDLAIQLQGNGSIVNPMVELFGAGLTAGYFLENDYTPNKEYFMAYPDYGSEITRHTMLMEFLGIPSKGDELEFPLNNSDDEAYESLELDLQPGSYICIHPGSRGHWRQWPAERFAAIADFCAGLGFKIVVTGTDAERSITAGVIKQMESDALNLTGKTNLGAIAILIKNAHALISNCTGVSHIAAAFKTPSIVISMDGEPERWGPINKQLHKTINWLENDDYNNVLNETKQLFEYVKLNQ